MRRATPLELATIVAPLVLLGAAPLTRAQAPDTTLVQIEKRFGASDRSSARALADSLITVLATGSPAYAEALYWRAFTAPSAADAERDYLAVSVEFPLSDRAPDALLNLAQLEYARHDRAAARRHFEQLLTDHPASPLVSKAAYWSARLSFESADTARACQVLATARGAVSKDDIELRNQIDYYTNTCTEAARADSAAARARADSITAAAARDSAELANRKAFSVQVASYKRRSDAAVLAATLKRRGYESRVFGTTAPYRVRVGRYPTHAAADSTLAKIKRTNPRAVVVSAEQK